MDQEVYRVMDQRIYRGMDLTAYTMALNQCNLFIFAIGARFRFKLRGLKLAKPRPQRRGPGSRCLPDGFRIDDGRDPGRPPYKAKDGHVVISASGREMGSRLLQIATGDPNAVANTGAFTGRMGLDDSPRKKVEA
jgi:hypothetical protein